MIIALCILYTVSLAWYVRRSLCDDFAAQLALKTITSCLFILIAYACYTQARGSRAYFLLMLSALISSLIGDVFIQMQRRTGAFTRYAFLCGGMAFFAAHLLFAWAFSLMAGFEWIDGAVLVALLVAMLCIFRALHLEFGKLRPLCILYAAAILLMFTKALSVWYTGGEAIAVLLVCGGALFVASDTMLALKNFHPRYRHNAPLALAVTFTYYTAQLLFALSILYV